MKGPKIPKPAGDKASKAPSDAKDKKKDDKKVCVWVRVCSYACELTNLTLFPPHLPMSSSPTHTSPHHTTPAQGALVTVLLTPHHRLQGSR